MGSLSFGISELIKVSFYYKLNKIEQTLTFLLHFFLFLLNILLIYIKQLHFYVYANMISEKYIKQEEIVDFYQSL